MSAWLAQISSSPALPLIIFFAEMCVVTLSTLRIIFVGRGLKGLASSIGLVEITIWLFAIGQIMKNLNDMSCFAGFAGGFTIGNYLGVAIEKKLALGTQVVRAITTRDATDLIEGLKSAGFGVTCYGAQGSTGPVQIVFTVIKRKELPAAVSVIKHFDKGAFYSVEDVQMASAGVFPRSRNILSWLKPTAFLPTSIRFRVSPPDDQPVLRLSDDRTAA